MCLVGRLDLRAPEDERLRWRQQLKGSTSALQIGLVRILNRFGSRGVEESSIFISKGTVDKCQQFIILLAHVWKPGPLGGSVVESKFV